MREVLEAAVLAGGGEEAGGLVGGGPAASGGVSGFGHAVPGCMAQSQRGPLTTLDGMLRGACER